MFWVPFTHYQGNWFLQENKANSHRAVVYSSEHRITTLVGAQWPSPEQFRRFRGNFLASRNLPPPTSGTAQTNLNMPCMVHPHGAQCVRCPARMPMDAQFQQTALLMLAEVSLLTSDSKLHLPSPPAQLLWTTEEGEVALEELRAEHLHSRC